MAYKVVFVEDEIVTREGIRDNVDWPGNGFEFCGEAADGEMALQLLQKARPDVLITDIKMPFMDGLQLCKIVRERMPWVVVVILSGHDEFEYAQEAIKLGVSEYLLKPVTVQDLHNALKRIAIRLENERSEQAKIRELRDQVEENRALLSERFLLKLVVGAVSPTEAVEKSRQLGLDIIAAYYLVVILKTRLADRSDLFDYAEYQQIHQGVADLVGKNPDVFLLKKDWEELVLLIKGNTPEFLEEERDLLVERIKKEVTKTRFQLISASGSAKNRIAHIYQSFTEALVGLQADGDEYPSKMQFPVDKAELLTVDRSAVENYLRCGTKEDFNEFFDAFIRPLGETALRSHLIKNYILVDVILATAKFLNEMGGDIDPAISELNSIGAALANIQNIEQLKDQVYKILINALVYRDSRPNHPTAVMVQQAKEYIEQHYMNQNLLLSDVAARVNLSPSHFSVVFSQATSQTFKEYLTEMRIKKAKELLRMTSLGSTEISYQVGYNDPHYFSYVFKKNTGMSPTEYRTQGQ